MKKILVAALAMIFVLGSFTLPAQAAGTGDITIFVNPGNAVSGATVSVTVNGQVRTAVSNYMGIATFSGLPVGSYLFKVSKTGYSDGSATFTIQAGSNTGTLRLGDQSGSARITVLDKTTNKPVSGVQVSVAANGSQQYQITDASGVVILTNIHNGTYSFNTLVSGYKDNSANVTVPANGTVTATIMIEPLRVVQSQTGDITVFVNPGDSVGGASVSVTVNGRTQTAVSDNLGRAKFAGIPSGTYTFRASAPGYYEGTAALVIYPGSNNGTIKMNPQLGNARVTVLDKFTNKPISGVQVSVSVRGASQYVNTDANGVAAFNSIQIGTYSFAALKSGYKSNAANVTVSLNGTAAATIVLAPPISATLHFDKLPKGLTYVSGYLKSLNGGSTTNISTIAKDQSITVADAGNYQFFARWKDQTGHYRQSKSQVVSITKSGTYSIYPGDSPSDVY